MFCKLRIRVASTILLISVMSFPRYSVCSCFAGIKEILIQQLFCRSCSVPVYDEGRQLEGRTVLDRYDKAVAELEKTEAKFDEDVMNYNQKLAQYNVGKDAVSSGKTAYNEGKAQLDAGWDAYNEGSEQLKNYDKAKAQYDKAKAQYDESLAAYAISACFVSKLHCFFANVGGHQLNCAINLLLLLRPAGFPCDPELSLQIIPVSTLIQSEPAPMGFYLVPSIIVYQKSTSFPVSPRK